MDSSHTLIVSYNPIWVDLYKTEAGKIKTVFGDELIGIEHIGSTSISGLVSKPIIDIMALVSNSEIADKYISNLRELDYLFDEGLHAKTQFPERHLFRKGNPTQYHLSISYADKGSFWKRQLAFRDYLRNHPEDRDRYGTLKLELIKKDSTGKDLYIEGKTDLVNKILDKSGFVRWKPSAQ